MSNVLWNEVEHTAISSHTQYKIYSSILVLKGSYKELLVLPKKVATHKNAMLFD